MTKTQLSTFMAQSRQHAAVEAGHARERYDVAQSEHSEEKRALADERARWNRGRGPVLVRIDRYVRDLRVQIHGHEQKSGEHDARAKNVQGPAHCPYVQTALGKSHSQVSIEAQAGQNESGQRLIDRFDRPVHCAQRLAEDPFLEIELSDQHRQRAQYQCVDDA